MQFSAEVWADKDIYGFQKCQMDSHMEYLDFAVGTAM